MTADTKLSKHDKVKALVVAGSTEGERNAAQAALDRTGSQLPLRIIATIISIDGEGTFYDVSFPDVAGKTRNLQIARELFQRPALAVAELIKNGAALSDDPKTARQQLQMALMSKTQAIYQLTSRPGWYERSFVYPGQTFGRLNGKLHCGPPKDGEPLGLRNGSLEAWREGLRAPCAASDYLILTLSNKAASMLLEIVGQEEGMVLHLHGNNRASTGEDKTKSSSGKSLATRVAASMSGRCRKNDLLTFAISIRALEDHCAGHNHLGIEFDEEGRSANSGRGPRVSASELSYIVSSGRGGVRSTKAIRDKDLKNRTWASNATTSGELPLDDPKVRAARPEGAQVRMIGQPVPPGSKGGIFNRVKGNRKAKMATCKLLAEQTEATISANYGVAFLAYAEKIVSRRDTLELRIKQIIDEFVQGVGADTTPWERRFAEKFGLAYGAAVLLAECGVAPWTQERAHQAISNMYKKARRAAATVDEVAEKLHVRLGRRLKKRRYPLVTKGAEISARRRQKARHGLCWDLVGHGRVLLIPIADVEQLVRPPAIATPVLRLLAKQKVVHVGPDGKLTRQVLVNALSKEKRRYVCFDVKALTRGVQGALLG